MVYVLVAYAAAWLGLFAYTLFLAGRQRELAAEVEWLENFTHGDNRGDDEQRFEPL